MGYSLGVRDSIMIAHSFKGAEFGPAQGVHGATYTVDCEFSSLNLVPGSNWVVDIGKALEVLSDVLSVYNYKNLDDLEEFKGQNTTTEFMCKVIHDKVSWRMKEHVTGDLKPQGMGFIFGLYSVDLDPERNWVARHPNYMRGI